MTQTLQGCKKSWQSKRGIAWNSPHPTPSPCCAGPTFLACTLPYDVLTGDDHIALHVQEWLAMTKMHMQELVDIP